MPIGGLPLVALDLVGNGMHQRVDSVAGDGRDGEKIDVVSTRPLLDPPGLRLDIRFVHGNQTRTLPEIDCVL